MKPQRNIILSVLLGGVISGLAILFWATNPSLRVDFSNNGKPDVAPNLAPDISHGKYVFQASGCAGCHTLPKGGELLAGGRTFKTPFGTFVSPNITPDIDHGIGNWNDADFVRAMRTGVSPQGQHYFPVFPYTSFTQMTDQDILDLKAYIFSLPAISKPNLPHTVASPFGWRFTVAFWKLLYFDQRSFVNDENESEQWNRGAYLVKALGHCGECHTPRNPLGGSVKALELSGTRRGPEGGAIPNLTPHKETGLGTWGKGDIEILLEMGMLPDGDFVGDTMTEVVDNGTSHLSTADRLAIETYLRSLPAINSDWKSKEETLQY